MFKWLSRLCKRKQFTELEIANAWYQRVQAGDLHDKNTYALWYQWKQKTLDKARKITEGEEI